MFTRRFFILLLLCIVLSMLSLAWAPLLVATKVLFYALLGLTAVDALISLVFSRRLAATRTVNERLSLSQPNAVQVSVSMTTPGAERYFMLSVFDTLPRTFAHSGSTASDHFGPHTYHVLPRTRGRYEFGALRAFLRSRWLGLFEVRRFFDLDTVVKVYPTFHNLDKLDTLASQDQQLGPKRVRRAGNNTEFEQIRQYVPGDDIRTINWRATARTTQLMVNTYTDEKSQPIVPIICSGPSMLIATEDITLLDRATSAAVALVASAVKHYDLAGIIAATHSGVDFYLKPERSQSTVSKVLARTYDFGLPPTDSEQVFIADPDVLPEGIDEQDLQQLHHRMLTCQADTDYDALATYVTQTLRRRSLLVLFANFENITSARHAIDALRRMAKRHVLVVVLFENEGVSAVASGAASDAGSTPSLAEMRFSSVCSQYIDQQHLLASFLRQNNINVLFTLPQNLTNSVLQKYLEIKDRGIL